MRIFGEGVAGLVGGVGERGLAPDVLILPDVVEELGLLPLGLGLVDAEKLCYESSEDGCRWYLGPVVPFLLLGRAGWGAEAFGVDDCAGDIRVGRCGVNNCSQFSGF